MQQQLYSSAETILYSAYLFLAPPEQKHQTVCMIRQQGHSSHEMRENKGTQARLTIDGRIILYFLCLPSCPSLQYDIYHCSLNENPDGLFFGLKAWGFHIHNTRLTRLCRLVIFIHGKFLRLLSVNTIIMSRAVPTNNVHNTLRMHPTTKNRHIVSTCRYLILPPKPVSSDICRRSLLHSF